jgi:hypothetical protein
MPWGDGTGPAGEGPMTGRRMGYCAGFDAPGCASAWPGRGRGGWGARHRYYATGVPGWARFGGGRYAARPVAPPVVASRAPVADEAAALRAQADYLAEALADIRTRLAELEQKGDK